MMMVTLALPTWTDTSGILDDIMDTTSVTSGFLD